MLFNVAFVQTWLDKVFRSLMEYPTCNICKVYSTLVAPCSYCVSKRGSWHKSPLYSSNTVCSSSFSVSVLILITSPNIVPDPLSSCVLSLGSHLFVHPLDVFKRNERFPSVPPLYLGSRKTVPVFTGIRCVKQLKKGGCLFWWSKDEQHVFCILLNTYDLLRIHFMILQLYLRYELL